MPLSDHDRGEQHGADGERDQRRGEAAGRLAEPGVDRRLEGDQAADDGHQEDGEALVHGDAVRPATHGGYAGSGRFSPGQCAAPALEAAAGAVLGDAADGAEDRALDRDRGDTSFTQSMLAVLGLGRLLVVDQGPDLVEGELADEGRRRGPRRCRTG